MLFGLRAVFVLVDLRAVFVLPSCCAALSCPFFSWLVLSCFVLSCLLLSCPVLSCPVLSCLVLSSCLSISFSFALYLSDDLAGLDLNWFYWILSIFLVGFVLPLPSLFLVVYLIFRFLFG